jgi:hypothetical protein
MFTLRPTRTSRLLLGLACCLALLAPAGTAAGGAAGPRGPQALAEATDGPAQGHLRDPLPGSLAAGNRRDDRERPGPALPGVLAAVAVPAAAGLAARRTVRAPGPGVAAAAGARAPPALQPAPS